MSKNKKKTFCEDEINDNIDIPKDEDRDLNSIYKSFFGEEEGKIEDKKENIEEKKQENNVENIKVKKDDKSNDKLEQKDVDKNEVKFEEKKRGKVGREKGRESKRRK